MLSRVLAKSGFKFSAGFPFVAQDESGAVYEYSGEPFLGAGHLSGKRTWKTGGNYRLVFRHRRLASDWNRFRCRLKNGVRL